jgi:sugar lactone lactonase YvrE
MKNKYLVNRRIVLSGWLALAMFVMFQHSSATEPDTMNRVRIKPTMTDVKTGGEQQFYVVKEPGRLISAYATNKVKWFVNKIAGGNKAVGTITKDGLYQAPKKAPKSPEIHIGAEVNAVSNRYLWATVLLNGERPQYKTVKEWGELVDDLKHLKDPKAIALEHNGNILILDGIIQRFSNDGAFIDAIGESKGNYDGSLVMPCNLAVDADGLIFVSDQKTGPPRLQTISPDGEYLYGFSGKGSGAGKVMDTHGMGISREQRLYVGDSDNNRLCVFEHSGEFVQNIGKKGLFPGEFNVPYGLAFDANDDLFVSSYFGPCQKLTSDGHFLLAFAYPDPPDGPICFTDVATDSWGNAYIIVNGAGIPDEGFRPLKDASGKRVNIKKYNNNGDFVANLRLSSKDREPLRLVTDMRGRIFVLYKGEKKIGVEILDEY